MVELDLNSRLSDIKLNGFSEIPGCISATIFTKIYIFITNLSKHTQKHREEYNKQREHQSDYTFYQSSASFSSFISWSLFLFLFFCCGILKQILDVTSFHSYIFPCIFKNKTFLYDNAFMGFPGGAVVKNLPDNAGDTGSSPGPGRSHLPQSK